MTPALRVVELTGRDSGAQREAFELRCTVQKHDQPDAAPSSWRSFVAQPHSPFPGSKTTVTVVYDGADVVALAEVSLPKDDNRDVAEVGIEVHPEHRGRGIGQEVLRLLRPGLRSSGRTRLLFECPSGGPGERFVRAAGARLVVADTERRLTVSAIDAAAHDRLLTDAVDHATDYELVLWIGPTPDDIRDDVAVLQARMSTDAPTDDLSWEPEAYDAAKIVARDQMMAAHGFRSYAAAACHRATAAVVGITTVVVPSDVPAFASQWETIVLPEHRGHRLGLLLKIANLRHAMQHERELREVHTWNAASNGPMVAVNVAMGFEPLREGGEWELTI